LVRINITKGAAYIVVNR